MRNFVAGGFYQNSYSSWNVNLQVLKLDTSTSPWSWSTLTLLPGKTVYSPSAVYGDRYIMTVYERNLTYFFKENGETGTLAAQTPMQISSSTGNNLVVCNNNLYLFYYNGQIYKLDESAKEWILEPKTLGETVRGKILLVSWDNLP